MVKTTSGKPLRQCLKLKAATQVRLQAVPTSTRRRRFELAILARRICDFTIAAISVSDQNRASGSISSCTTRINPKALSLSKRHAARFDLLRDHRAGPTRSSLPMAPLEYAGDCNTRYACNMNGIASASRIIPTNLRACRARSVDAPAQLSATGVTIAFTALREGAK